MNVYEMVTEQMIKQLESGCAPWRKPWNSKEPCNLVSQQPYRGIDTFHLSASGFRSPYWLTYRQAIKLGGNVRNGEHSHIVVFWNVGEEKLNPKTGELSKPLRYYRVFNFTQTEGIQSKLGLEGEPPKPIADIAACEQSVCGMPRPPAIQSSDRAWYRPSADVVGMPDKSIFNSAEGYSVSKDNSFRQVREQAS